MTRVLGAVAIAAMLMPGLLRSQSVSHAGAAPRSMFQRSAAQRPAVPPPFVAGYRTMSDVSLRIYAPAGRLRIIVWARDSVAIAGTQSTRATRFGGGSSTHLKIGVEPSVAGDTTLPTVDWEVMVPARARVWAKMIDGTIDVVGSTANDAARLAAEFELYTVRGEIRARDVRGVLSIESIDAPVTIARTFGDVRVRGGRGAVDLADVSGTLSVATVSGAVVLTSLRADGRVETIGGAIALTGPRLSGKQLELQTHAGAIVLTLESSRAPQLLLSSRAQPVRGASIKGTASYGTVVARSFKGTIRVEPVRVVP